MRPDLHHHRIGCSLVRLQPEEESDLGNDQAPPSVAGSSRGWAKHEEETLCRLVPPWRWTTTQGKAYEMELIYERCCGIDVHKKMLVACLMTPGKKGERQKEIRTFRTGTGDLLALHDWLQEADCSHVALERSGVYTPPTILPIVGGGIRRGWKRHRTDTEDNTDLLLMHFYTLDHSPNDIPSRLKITRVQSLFDFSCKRLQTS
jgi:hypothetical protein